MNPISINPVPPALGPAAASAERSTDPKLAEAAEAFEALFLNQLLKTMRASLPKGGLFDSQHMQGYQQMQDQQLATSLAKTRSVGIAELMIQQLSANTPAQDHAEPTSIALKGTFKP